MFDAITYDMTPADAPIYSVEWRQAAATPLPKSSPKKVLETQFLDNKDSRRALTRTSVNETRFSVLSFGALTPTDLSAEACVESESSALAVKATADRSLILARKYGSGVSREESSRLDILTVRLRNLVPRVSEEQMDALASMVGETEETADALAAIGRRYAAQ